MQHPLFHPAGTSILETSTRYSKGTWPASAPGPADRYEDVAAHPGAHAFHAGQFGEAFCNPVWPRTPGQGREARGGKTIEDGHG